MIILPTLKSLSLSSSFSLSICLRSQAIGAASFPPEATSDDQTDNEHVNDRKA